MKCNFCGADRPTEETIVGNYCEACLEILISSLEIALEEMRDKNDKRREN